MTHLFNIVHRPKISQKGSSVQYICPILLCIIGSVPVMGYLSGVLDSKDRKTDKRVQTVPCPYLDAQPLVVAEADEDGKVILGVLLCYVRLIY